MADAAVESPQPETSAGSAVRVASTGGTERSPSPPPNCAICLGNCINKCFSDSCMHQFCFKCLLEWSKVKAECPLCKQPFKSIIHNVKSNEEYDQHFVPQATPAEGPFDGYVFPDPISTSRHFQFRTTLTVDPRGELAIQQLLSTHSMTNSLPHYNTTLSVIRNPRYFYRARRSRDISTSQFRRSLYERNLWTNPVVDVTGRYRDVSPSFFREYPGCKNRLVPFLQRELNALIPDDSLRAMNLVQLILSTIDNHPIRGRYMKSLLQPELGSNTDHFIYEFYTYARSPYDLHGYDHTAVVMPDMHSQHTVDSSDSDVLIVSVDNASPRPRIVDSEVIEIGSESSHDSDVVIREPTPPVLVDLANTTEATESDPIEPAVNDADSKLPAKLRHKRARRSPQRKRRCLTRSRSRSSSSSSWSTSTSESSSSSTSTSEPVRRRLRKRRMVMLPYKSESSHANDASSDDEAQQHQKRKRLRKKKQLRRHSQTAWTTTNALRSNVKDEQVAADDCDTQPPSEYTMPDTQFMCRIPEFDGIKSEVGEIKYSDRCMDMLKNEEPYYGNVQLRSERGDNEPGPSGLRYNSELCPWYPKPYPDSDSD